MTRDELHYLADHVNDEMFDRIRALREQVKVLSEEKIHSDRRINNQRKELKRKDERIKGLREIIEDILDGAEGATVAPEPTNSSTEKPELREYRFSRYVNGKLKAEGAVVMATSDQHAAEKLTKLCCDHPAILVGGQLPTAPDPRDEALRAKGFLVRIYVEPDTNIVEVLSAEGDRMLLVACNPLPTAICHAALLAHEVKEEEL